MRLVRTAEVCRTRTKSASQQASGAIPGFHSVSGELRRTILGKADVWYVPRRRPRRNMERWIEQTSTQRSHLLVPMRVDTVSGRLTGLWTEQPSFGWWVPVAVRDEDTAKALAAWWNSTPSRLMLLNRRARKLTYPVWQLAHLREIRIPKPDNPAWSDLRNAFEEVKRVELLPMSQAERCQARLVLDVPRPRPWMCPRTRWRTGGNGWRLSPR